MAGVKSRDGVPGLVAFDVDGTLLRGPTICQCLARALGRAEEMEAFERLSTREDIAKARAVMLDWYRPHQRSVLLEHLRSSVTLAPGAREGIKLLRASGVKVALVSITWEFAVEWLRAELGADFAVGTKWLAGDEIGHFWPENKANWLTEMLLSCSLCVADLAAVGDSTSDLPMLQLAGRGYFVGVCAPVLPPHVEHWPHANIADIAQDFLDVALPGATARRAKR
ncbi:MAG: HAD family hydrolase [Fimbriimonadales bacterium]